VDIDPTPSLEHMTEQQLLDTEEIKAVGNHNVILCDNVAPASS